MTKREILEMEYQENELVNKNFSFEEFLELYEEWKTYNNILSFNNFISMKLWEDERVTTNSRSA
mgnify:CR=1 FL=1